MLTIPPPIPAELCVTVGILPVPLDPRGAIGRLIGGGRRVVLHIVITTLHCGGVMIEFPFPLCFPFRLRVFSVSTRLLIIKFDSKIEAFPYFDQI